MAIMPAKKITSFFIQNKVIKEEEKDTYEYCFQVLILNLLNFGTVLLIAIICRRVMETICYVAGFFVIRKQAGGYHASTPFRCYLLSILNYLLFLFLLKLIPATWNYQITLGLSILSFVVIWLFAPIADKNKPFHIGEYQRYQRNSRIIISLILILNILIFCMHRGNIQVLMLSLCLGNLFAAVSLVFAKYRKG